MDDTIDVLKKHAVQVYRALGKGHSERVYHRAMITSLNRKGILHRSEVIAPIWFMGEVVGFGRCDILIDDLVVEFKANMRCPSATSAQLKKYMESLAKSERRICKGVIINFNQRSGMIDILEERPIPPSRKRPAPQEVDCSRAKVEHLERWRYIKRQRK